MRIEIDSRPPPLLPCFWTQLPFLSRYVGHMCILFLLFPVSFAHHLTQLPALPLTDWRRQFATCASAKRLATGAASVGGGAVLRSTTAILYQFPSLSLSFPVFFLTRTGMLIIVPSIRSEGVKEQPVLRCYQCNIDGFPECNDPFLLEYGSLANCSSARLDGRREMCAKIIGTHVTCTSS